MVNDTNETKTSDYHDTGAIMMFNMFSRDVPRWFKPYLDEMRTVHESEGGKAKGFPKWFKEEHGVSMLGVCCVVPDETASYATLRYGQGK